MSLALWFSTLLHQHFATGESNEATELLDVALKERNAAIVNQEKLPTFADVWGCLEEDCGVIQALPKGHRCHVCQSEQIANLTMQLKRGGRRINNLAAQKRATR